MRGAINKTVLIFLLGTILNGCATVLNFSELGDKRIYGGTRMGIHGTGNGAYQVKLAIQSPEAICDADFWETIGVASLFTIDLPFSFLADTLTLHKTVSLSLEKPLFYKIQNHHVDTRYLLNKLNLAKKYGNVAEQDKIIEKAQAYITVHMDELLDCCDSGHQRFAMGVIQYYDRLCGEKLGEILEEKFASQVLAKEVKRQIISYCYEPASTPIPQSVYRLCRELGLNTIAGEYVAQQKVIGLAMQFCGSNAFSWGEISSLYRAKSDSELCWHVFFDKYQYGHGRSLLVDLGTGEVQYTAPSCKLARN